MRRAEASTRIGWIDLLVLAVPVVVAVSLPPTWRHGFSASVPAAHQVPAVPGGTALRLAMIHDVLCERYPRRGTAWHEARIADRLARITAPDAGASPANAEVLSAYDDAAVSLDQLHRFAEAEALMRRKLALIGVTQPDPAAAAPVVADLLGKDPRARAARMASPVPEERYHRYTASANLATVIIHGAIAAARAGDQQARARMDEGREWLLDAIAIHPGAHFGREAWQLVAIDWFRASLADASLVQRCDMIGDQLTEPRVRRSHPPAMQDPFIRAWIVGGSRTGVFSEQTLDARSRQRWREAIATVGNEVPGIGPAVPVPFDEPALALIGMWMYGGGPNPHSALALAGIAERIGQRQLAWEGYARALSLAERFHPDPAVREALTAHCRKRQAAIQAQWISDGDAMPPEERQRRFDAELAFGRQWQSDWQAEEARRLAAGAGIDSPELREPALLAVLPPIATVPAEEEWQRISLVRGRDEMIVYGLVAGFALLLLRLFLRQRRQRTLSPR